MALGGETVFIGDAEGKHGQFLIDNGILHTDQIPDEIAYQDSVELLARPEHGDPKDYAENWTGFDAPMVPDEEVNKNTDLKAQLTKAKANLLNYTVTARAQVAPRQGSALLFWTRKADFAIDPLSFHGGRSVKDGLKFTLQKFKELPEEKRKSKPEAAGFVQESLEGAQAAYLGSLGGMMDELD